MTKNMNSRFEVMDLNSTKCVRTCICVCIWMLFWFKTVFFWMSVASWCSACFCAVLYVWFCTDHFVMVPVNLTCLHFCNILSLNIFSNYIKKIEFRSCAKKRQRCGIFQYHWWLALIKPRLFSHVSYAS